MTKYALGTVQFGLDYGINNSRGKIPPADVNAILKAAAQGGIDLLDTAQDYGDSEQVIGQAVAQHPGAFRIVTKIRDCPSEKAEDFFDQSLKRLNAASVYGLLIHHFEHYQADKALWDVFQTFKRRGQVTKIGFSLYYPRDLEMLLRQNIRFDLVQVPYSLLDRRFEPYFETLKDLNVEVHVRSVFLQGLIFKQPDHLAGHFLKIRPKIEALRALSRRADIPLEALALNFAVLNDSIDKVVLGVDSREHLESFLKAGCFLGGTKNILNELKTFQEDDEQLILPMNWK